MIPTILSDTLEVDFYHYNGWSKIKTIKIERPEIEDEIAGKFDFVKIQDAAFLNGKHFRLKMRVLAGNANSSLSKLYSFDPKEGKDANAGVLYA